MIKKSFDIRISDVREFISKDKRKSERLAIQVRLLYAYSLLEEWRGPFLIDDISGQGVRFGSDTMLALGTKLYLKILFSEESMKPIVVESEVCWRAKKKHGYTIGVKFHKMNDTDRRRYIEYISEKILLKYLQ